jgi:hypothetical protein
MADARVLRLGCAAASAPHREVNASACALISAPEILEPIRRQLGVAHGMLDILVAEIGLGVPACRALVGQGEPARAVAYGVGGPASHAAPPHDLRPPKVTGGLLSRQKPRRFTLGVATVSPCGR